jgi:hypothetical protein
MENDFEHEVPGLALARLFTFLLLCVVAVTASYVESRSPTQIKASSSIKP